MHFSNATEGLDSQVVIGEASPMLQAFGERDDVAQFGLLEDAVAFLVEVLEVDELALLSSQLQLLFF